MLKFKYIRWKNLLSTGNAFTEIDLETNGKSTLIIGENGAGKSTILDALTFALYGKSFRKINKPGLVNSVNEKDCIVEIEFESNGKKYKIIRGIKPNIFEIYTNGVLVNQSASTTDYQEYLDKYILRMNFKSFTQIVILGSASFTPFMQLVPADRRAVIESLLDIQVFSVMNVLAKSRLQTNREEYDRVMLKIKLCEEKKSLIEKTLNSLKQNRDEKLSEMRKNDDAFENERNLIIKDIEYINAQRLSFANAQNELNDLREKHKKLIQLHTKIDSKVALHNKEKSFFHDNDTCPTCAQIIAIEFRKEKLIETDNQLITLNEGLSKLDTQITKLLANIQSQEKYYNEDKKLHQSLIQKQSELQYKDKQIESNRESIRKLENSDSMIDSNEKSLIATQTEFNIYNNERKELLVDREYLETAIILLKDGGIKTKIIKQYLPIINKHINKYLSAMGFYVDFNINENFEETIKSRYRDSFGYENFSEGEKTRIDLALLFTWRHVAKVKNSAATNLLVLDEIFDGSLDANGTDEFLKIMNTLTGDTNTFIISHKTDAMLDKFDKVIRFEKRNNFSRIAITEGEIEENA